MKRVYGSEGLKTIECINPRLSKYRVRWDFQPNMVERPNPDKPEETVEVQEGVSFLELEYLGKPSIDTVLSDIISTGTLATLEEVQSMANLLEIPALEPIRTMLLAKITEYDLSENVNSFTLNGSPAWFDKVLRTSIERQIQARQTLGQETAPIAYGNVILQVPIEAGLGMLCQLEVYASDCYNKTTEHKASVSAIQEESELISYDYKTGYPEKLSFEIK